MKLTLTALCEHNAVAKVKFNNFVEIIKKKLCKKYICCIRMQTVLILVKWWCRNSRGFHYYKGGNGECYHCKLARFVSRVPCYILGH